MKTDISGVRLEVPGGGKEVMLHSCCAPCSGAILECMTAGGIRPVIFFSNSNIFPKSEYELRLAELKRYADSLGLEVVEDEYDHGAWLERVRGLEREPERGARCTECFKFRLERAAACAAARGIPVLTTSLASSRWKDLAQVNAAGAEACDGTGVCFWEANWRKSGLQPRRNEIIAEQAFYNQTFCGCEFSK